MPNCLLKSTWCCEKMLNLTLSGFYLCNLAICLYSSISGVCKRVPSCSKSPVRLWCPHSFVFIWHQGLFLAEEWTLPWTSNQCRCWERVERYLSSFLCFRCLYRDFAFTLFHNTFLKTCTFCVNIYIDGYRMMKQILA